MDVTIEENLEEGGLDVTKEDDWAELEEGDLDVTVEDDLAG